MVYVDDQPLRTRIGMKYLKKADDKYNLSEKDYRAIAKEKLFLTGKMKKRNLK